MTENKTSEAQKIASKTWKERNPERNRYLRNKSVARTFARHY